MGSYDDRYKRIREAYIGNTESKKTQTMSQSAPTGSYGSRYEYIRDRYVVNRETYKKTEEEKKATAEREYRQQMQKELEQLRTAYAAYDKPEMQGIADNRSWEEIYAENEERNKVGHRIKMLENQMQVDKSEAYYQEVLKRLSKLDEDTVSYVDQLNAGMPDEGLQMQGVADNRSWEDRYAERQNWENELMRKLSDKGYSRTEIAQMRKDRERQVNRENYEAEIAESQQEATDNGFLASVKSIPQNLSGGLGTISLVAQNAHKKLTGDDTPVDYYTPEMIGQAKAQAARQTVTKRLEDNDRNVAAFLYNTGMSMADSAAVAGMAALGVPPAAGTALLGGSAAIQAARDAKERGVSDEQALWTGLAAGAAEMIFEKISLDRLLATSPTEGVLRQRFLQTAKNIGKQSFTEGSEELFTSVANSIADAVINGEKSYYNQSIYNYMMQGMEYGEAVQAATRDWAASLAQDFLAGAISGGVMGGVATEAGNAFANMDANAFVREQYGSDPQVLVDRALEIDPKSKTAQIADKRLKDGKKLDSATMRSLVMQTARAKVTAEGAEANPSAVLSAAVEQMVEDANARKKASAPVTESDSPKTDFTEEEARYIVEEGAKGFGNAASSVVNSYMRSQDPQLYMAQAKLAFNYGKTMSEEKGLPYALNSPALKSLDETQIRSLFNAGRMQAKSIPVSAVKGTGKAVLGDGLDYSLLSPVQQKQYNALAAFAKATGYTIEFFESKVGEDGKYTAEQGSFNTKTGVIRIDINAGRDKVTDLTNYAMVRVASHEITHSFKKNAPQQYVALRDYVTGVLADKGRFEDLVDKKMRDLGIDHETAVDEVVADGCEMLLRDTRFAEKLAKENRTLFEKIRDAIRKFVKKLRDAFEGVEIAHEEALLLKDAENLQKLWDEALAKSVENVAAAEEVIRSGAKPVSSNEIITDGAVVVGNDGKMFSIRSMKSDIAEGKMFDDLVKYCGWSQAKVDELRNQLSDLVAYMEPHRDILDMNESYGREGRKFSPYKPNSDPLYQISMDFSTLCSKRLLTQYVIENLQLRENRPMSAEEQMAIRDMLIEYRNVEKGLQVACAMCYVEAARLKSPKQMQRWLDDPSPLLRDYFGKANKEFNASVKEAQADFKESRGYARNAPKKEMSAADVREFNKIGPRMRAEYQLSEEEQKIVERAKALPNSTYLTAANLAKLSETDPVIYNAYTSFVRTATRSKSLETDEPYYYGDSTRDNGNGIIVSDSFIEAVNRENGMRFSSWSDWRIQHLLDYISAVIDNSVRGAAMHGYTKFAEEVRVLGKTGMMFNLSGVAGTQTGLNPDGSLSFSTTESIDINDAIELRKEFPDTAGLQCIGVSDEHIFALLRSDIIDYVIPYHVSGLNKGLRRMADIHGWKDYTSTQHASVDSSVKNNGQEHWHEEPVFSEFFVGYDTGLTGEKAMQKSAERYVKMCRERGLTPKFEKFVNEPGYWKLLVDRKMINQKTGKLIQQKPVTPTFDFEAIKGVVDRYVENYDSGLESRALDYVVKNWDSVPGRIRTLKKSGVKKTKSQQALDTLYNEMMAAQPTETQYSKPEGVEREDGVNYSFRTGYIPTDRSILTSYVPKDSDSDTVKKHIAEYQKNAKELKAMQLKRGQMVHDLEALADNNDPKSRAEKKRLREEIVKTDSLIQGLLDQLSRKERWYGVKEVLQKEKTEIMRKAKAEKNEQLKKYREQRWDTENRRKLRERITYRVKTLDKMLREPTDDKHIPEELRKAVFDFCEVFQDEVGVFSQKQLDRLNVAYAFLAEEHEGVNASYLYDEDIKEMISQLGLLMDGKRLSELSVEALKFVHNIADHMYFIVRDENEVFLNGRKVKMQTIATKAIEEAKESEKKGGFTIGRDGEAFVKFLTSGNLKPVYLFERTGNQLRDLFNGLLAGQSEYGRREQKAKAFVEQVKKDTNYSEWSSSEETLKMTNGAGQQIELTVQQAMSLLATYERELRQGLFHVTKGGFVYENGVTGDVTVKGVKVPVVKRKVEAEAHPMTVDDMDKVRQWLGSIDSGTLDYMERMVEYLSTTMAAYGNETSMQLHGYKKFSEGYYFPIRSSDDYLNKDPGKGGFDENRWKNKGFTKALTKSANNPFVLIDFDKVWSNHVSQMLMYSTMAVPQESFVRVLNFKTPVDPTGLSNSESMRGIIKQYYGSKVADYIDTLLRDINGGVTTDSRATVLNRLVSTFKKNATFASASVVVQQISSVARATALIAPKHFAGGNPVDGFKEALEHSGVAVIKQMGGFDTTTGRGGAEWLMEETPEGFKNKAKAFVRFGEKDTGYRDRIFSALPAKMDELGFGMIWNAAKNEVSDSGKYEDGTDAFYEAVTKRFEEVIEKTQVYDSVLSRSENMRGKDGLLKAATSFMAEPTVTANMMMDAAWKLTRNKDAESGKYLGRVVASLVLAMLANNLLKAAATAPRDKDEDQTILEKYVEDVAGGIKSDINPFGYVPILRDIKSIWEGYTVEASYAAPIADAFEAFKDVRDEGSFNDWVNLVVTSSGFIGLPLKNLKRDLVDSVINLFGKTANISESSTRGLRNAILEGWNGELPGVDDAMEKAYRADKRGNEAQRKKALEEVKKLYEDKVKQFRLEGKQDAAKKAKSSLKSSITAELKPLYQAATTQAEKNRIKSLALRVYVGGEQLYNGYDFERYWGEE